MSNIYVNEPPTSGKVCMRTSVGDIDIELWSKETPKACRNFIQLAMEGYFDNTIFHRIVKDFIVQGGDSTGTGLGGDSIFNNEPFKDEFHSRIKFNRRGLVAMANAGKDDNKSQFFFTMGATPELNNKHTIFGKVTGTTIFNMLKLQEGSVDQNERPETLKKIYSIEILKNPFDDIIPREKKQKTKVESTKVKSKSKATKDFKLLSFGEEAEEEECDLNMVIEKDFKNKSSKSAPDLIEQPVVSRDEHTSAFKKKMRVALDEKDDEEECKVKLTDSNESLNKKRPLDDDLSSSEDEFSEARKKMEEARAEIEKLKKEEFKKRAIEKFVNTEKEKKDNNPILNEFKKAKEKYNKPSFFKGADREQQALMLLEKFKKKMKADEPKSNEESNWLKHKLKIDEEDEQLVLAKDANLKKEEDWYDIFDPRNPLNKQRREMDAGIVSKKKRK